jgi:hypothetical protein
MSSIKTSKVCQTSQAKLGNCGPCCQSKPPRFAKLIEHSKEIVGHVITQNLQGLPNFSSIAKKLWAMSSLKTSKVCQTSQAKLGNCGPCRQSKPPSFAKLIEHSKEIVGHVINQNLQGLPNFSSIAKKLWAMSSLKTSKVCQTSQASQRNCGPCHHSKPPRFAKLLKHRKEIVGHVITQNLQSLPNLSRSHSKEIVSHVITQNLQSLPNFSSKARKLWTMSSIKTSKVCQTYRT